MSPLNNKWFGAFTVYKKCPIVLIIPLKSCEAADRQHSDSLSCS